MSLLRFLPVKVLCSKDLQSKVSEKNVTFQQIVNNSEKKKKGAIKGQKGQGSTSQHYKALLKLVLA